MRRLFLSFALIAAILVAMLGTLPWWWGPALKYGGPRFGLTFGNYTREGYSRWALTDVTWTGQSGRFTARRMELPNPVLALLRMETNGPLKLSNWRWVQKQNRRDPTPHAGDPAGWAPAYEHTERTIGLVARWLPGISADDGVVAFGGREILLPNIEWSPATLQLDFTDVTIAGGKYNGHAQWDSWKGVLHANIRTDEGEADLTASARDVVLTGQWWDQPITGSATFGQDGWLPVAAEVSAAEWKLPGSRMKLGGRYEQVRLSVLGVWHSNQYNWQLSAEGTPAPNTQVPEFKINLEANGDRNALTVGLVEVHLPGLEATLSEPVTLALEDWRNLSKRSAVFTLNTDLAVLTQNAAKGRVTGRMHIGADENNAPRIDADLTIDNLQWRDWPTVSGQADVKVDGHTVRVSQGALRAGDESRLDLSGDWNWKSRRVENLTVAGVVARRWLVPWIPEKLQFGEVDVKLAAEGIWPELNHQGRLEIREAVYGPSKPSSWTIEWTGRGYHSVVANIAGEAGKSRVQAETRVHESGITFNDLSLRRADGEELALMQPATFSWAPTMQLKSLRMGSPAAKLSLDWGEGAQMQLQVDHVERSWLEDWINLPGPDWTFDGLTLEGSEKSDVWQGHARFKGGIAIAPDRSAQILLEARFGPDGLMLDQGVISEGGRPILNASGTLPLYLTPGSDHAKWKIDADGPLALSLNSTDNDAFWQQVNTALGWELVSPKISAEFKGTWGKPEGEAVLQVTKLRADPQRWSARWPEITDLQAKLHGEASGVELQEFRAQILGQVVQASGRMPLDGQSWRKLKDDPLAYLHNSVVGRLEIPSAELASWAVMAPRVIAPTGTLSLVVTAKGKGEFDGRLTLTDAATRPLGPLGALQDLSAKVHFDGRRIILESMQAHSGGRPVVLKGDATWLESGYPKLDLTLTGENLPLVRQSGLLLRGDLDLKLQTENSGLTWVRGGVKLRDGLFLVDLQSLRPSGARGPSTPGRPPYFSVQEMPFADWQLDVALSGRRFLRMETPVFSGRASAQFQLQGSLREPRAIGEATVSDGLVKLPFATFDISEGWVRLLQSDPYVPKISFVGNARRLGYDLRMELTGTANAPNLQFFSSPPLASEEVLLLVMAGEAPADEVTYSTSQRATKLGAYLGQSLINQFTGHSGGEDRLTISTGENVSHAGRETYRMEYELSDRWSLVGEYDEFDDYNAGLKWKVFSSDNKEKDDGK